jgi:hypothetical protein
VAVTLICGRWLIVLVAVASARERAMELTQKYKESNSALCLIAISQEWS